MEKVKENPLGKLFLYFIRNKMHYFFLKLSFLIYEFYSFEQKISIK